MPGSHTQTKRLSARGVAAGLIGALIIIALAIALITALFRGAAGCVGFLKYAEYADEDEAARLGIAAPTEPPRVFSDSAYDAVYPDLAEYTEATRSETE